MNSCNYFVITQRITQACIKIKTHLICGFSEKRSALLFVKPHDLSSQYNERGQNKTKPGLLTFKKSLLFLLSLVINDTDVKKKKKKEKESPLSQDSSNSRYGG